MQTKTRVLWEPAGSRWNPSPNNVAPFPAAPPPVLESPTHSTSAVLNQEPLDWATDMVAHIAEIDTDYDHGLGPVTWAGQHDATTYASRTDCSGFILYVDPATRAITGYSWSTITVSPYFSQADRPLVVGRLDPTHAW